MAVTIADFVIRVRNQIRDNGSVQAFPDLLDSNSKPIPGTSPELIQFIQDAIMDYSKYMPRKRSFTLNLIQGQTVYQLPDDWMFVDYESFENAMMPTPLPEPSVYALPFIYVNRPLGNQVNTMQFNWYDDDQQLVLNSAPFQPYTLTFDYYAYHTVDDTSCTIPKQLQFKALLPAYEKALRAIATDYSVKLQKYKIGGRGGIEIDDSKIAESLLKQADDYRDQYRKEIVLRPYGTSGGNDDGIRG
jgi:hypothetical protein